jgi:hypothetical protein
MVGWKSCRIWIWRRVLPTDTGIAVAPMRSIA